MGCVYKFGGVTYNSLEELMSFVNKNNTENTIEKKDESSPSFFSKVLKNIFSIAVASNPSKNGINSQKPYSTQEQQLEAYGILSNEPKSVQLGSVLNLKRFKRGGNNPASKTDKYPKKNRAGAENDSDYVYEFYDESGTYIGNLRDVSFFNENNTQLQDGTNLQEYIETYKATIANLDKHFDVNDGVSLLITVDGKSTGQPLDTKSLGEFRTISDLIGNDNDAKLVNITKEGKITIDGKDYNITECGLDIDVKSVQSFFTNNPNLSFASMVLLPTPVKSEKGIYYKAFSTNPTKVNSGSETAFNALDETTTAIFNACLSQNFTSIEGLGITNTTEAQAYLSQFFKDVELTDAKKLIIKSGESKGRTVTKGFDINRLQTLNLVLKNIPDSVVIKLLENGVVKDFNYSDICKKSHTTSLNYSTAVEGKPRTYFSNPRVDVNLNSFGEVLPITQGNTTEPVNNTPVVEKLTFNISKRYEDIEEFKDGHEKSYFTGEFKPSGSNQVVKLNSEGVVLGVFHSIVKDNKVVGREFDGSQKMIDSIKANGYNKELKALQDRSKLIYETLGDYSIKRLEKLISEQGLKTVIDKIKSLDGGKYSNGAYELDNNFVNYYMTKLPLLKEYIYELEDSFDAPKEEIQTAGTTIGGKTLQQLELEDRNFNTVNSPQVTTSERKPLVSKKSDALGRNGISNALSTEQIQRLLDLSSEDGAVNKLNDVRSLAAEVSSYVLKGKSLEEAIEIVKESLENNFERATQLSDPQMIEENYDILEPQEKVVEFNIQAAESISIILDNFDNYITSVKDLLEDSGITISENASEASTTEEQETQEETSIEENDIQLEDSGSSEKIHSKSAMEYNPFVMLDSKVKAFLGTVASTTMSRISFINPYGSEKLFIELAELVTKNEINTVQDFVDLVSKNSTPYHIQDFLHKFKNLPTETQNIIVKSFSLEKNRFIVSEKGKVMDSNRASRDLQLGSFLQNIFGSTFIKDGAITEKFEDFHSFIKGLWGNGATNTTIEDVVSLFNHLGFGVSEEQKEGLKNLMFQTLFVGTPAEALIRELQLRLAAIASKPTDVTFQVSEIAKTLNKYGIQNVFFANAGTMIINKDGNKIYTYSVPNMVSEIVKRSAKYIKDLKVNAFSQSSTLLEKLSKGLTQNTKDTAHIIYMDGVDGKGFSKLTSQEKMQARLDFFTNSKFTGKYPFFSSAKEAKTLVQGVLTPKVFYTKESGAKEIFRIIKAEIARMVESSETKVNALGYSPNAFYLFPELNKGGEFALDYLLENGEVNFGKLTDEVITEVSEKLVDKYVNETKRLLPDIKSALLNATESEMQEDVEDIYTSFTMNEMVNNFEYMATFSNNPAFTGKKTVAATLAAYFKRLSSDISPSQKVPNLGSQKIVVLPDSIKRSKNFGQILEKLDGLTLEEFEALSEDEQKKLTSYPYANINRADAQGYVSLRKYLQIMHNSKSLPLDKYNELIAKIDSFKGKDIADIVFTDEELSLVLQPLKPIFVGNKLQNGVMVKHFVKLSAFPLLPQLYTKGDQCLDYARFLHENDVDYMVFESAYKVGSPKLLKDLSKYNAQDHLSELPSEFFGIQQEIPYDETKTLMLQGSQILKLLFNNIKNPELSTEFYSLQEELVNNYLDTIKEKLGINVDEFGNFSTESLESLKQTLLKEFKKKGMLPQDVANFDLTSDGKSFKIPLMFNKLGHKLESTVLNMFNKLGKQKLGGKSYVLISEHGFSGRSSDIIKSDSYNEKKGLQPMRIVDGKVLPAQIMVTWDFQDSKGNILDIKDFMKNGKLDFSLLPKDLLEGIGYRIPSQGHNSMSFVEIVGFLPKYMGSSVVAPADFVAQMGSDFDIDKLYLHKKTYKYLPHTANYQGNGKGRFVVEGTKISDKTDTKPAVYKQSKENRIVEIYREVLSNPETFKSIIKPLDFGSLPFIVEDLKATKKTKYEENKKALEDIELKLKASEGLSDVEKFFLEKNQKMLFKEVKTFEETSLSILYPRTQNNNYEAGVAGKDCVGLSSLLSTFSAIVQNSGLKVLPFTQWKDSLTGQIKSIGFKPKFQVGDNVIELTILDSSEPLIKTEGSVEETEIDVISAFQSAAVDNAKELYLSEINYSADTHNILTGMVKSRLDTQTIVYFLTHPIVKNSDDFKSKISINDTLPLNFDRLKNGTESDDVVSAYMDYFNSLGKEINGVSSAVNITSKGFGKNLGEIDFKTSLIPVEGSSAYLAGTSAVYTKEYFRVGIENMPKVNTWISKLFGLDKQTFDTYKEFVKNEVSKKSSSKDVSKKLTNFFKSFVFNNAKPILNNDAEALRQTLFFGENSLANQLLSLKQANPEEKFLEYLSANIDSSKEDKIRQISSNLFTIENPLEKLQWQLDFEKHYFDENSKFNKFVKDLVLYTYLAGGIQDANSIVSSIPSTVTRDFQEDLFTDSLLEDFNLSENIALQFFQHHPELLPISETEQENFQNGEIYITFEKSNYPKVKKFYNAKTDSYFIGMEESTSKNQYYDVTYKLYPTKGVYGMKEITPIGQTSSTKTLSAVEEKDIFSGLGFDSNSLDTVVNNILTTIPNDNPIAKNFKLLQEVLKAQGTNIKIVLSSNLGQDSKGTYENDVITIYKEGITDEEDLLETILHEMTHSIVDRYIDGNLPIKSAPVEIQRMVIKLKRLQEVLKGRVPESKGIGAIAMKGSLKEFVAYAISNKAAQKWLNSMKVGDSTTEGFWDRMATILKDFVTTIANSLGLVELTKDSLATISLNEVEKLLKTIEKEVTLVKSNEEFKNKVLSNWSEFKDKLVEVGLIDKTCKS